MRYKTTIYGNYIQTYRSCIALKGVPKKMREVDDDDFR